MNLQHSESFITGIYERHADTIYRICILLLKNKQDAEDATQSVFTKLITSKMEFAGSEHEKAWLITVSKNHCINLLRSSWYKKRTSFTDLEICLDTVGTNSNTVFQDPAEKLETDNITEKVLALPEKYKIVLYLYYYEGYKTAEISKMFSINEATVRTRLRTAKKRLKLAIEEEEKNEGKRTLSGLFRNGTQ